MIDEVVTVVVGVGVAAPVAFAVWQRVVEGKGQWLGVVLLLPFAAWVALCLYGFALRILKGPALSSCPFAE
jgi:hypothetical protein